MTAGKLTIHGYKDHHWWQIFLPKQNVTIKTHDDHASETYAHGSGVSFAKKMGIDLDEN
jgi:hypothetical protein